MLVPRFTEHKVVAGYEDDEAEEISYLVWQSLKEVGPRLIFFAAHPYHQCFGSRFAKYLPSGSGSSRVEAFSECQEQRLFFKANHKNRH
jgi:hypothetical protein